MSNLPTYVVGPPAQIEAPFIGETIISEVGQTIPSIKWVIVSDGLNNGTDDIARKYAGDYNWIELVRMPERSERHLRRRFMLSTQATLG
jgi:hypothetical protein